MRREQPSLVAADEAVVCGAGGGGAGGVSVGILQKGPAPDVDQATDIGESGGGMGGTAGKGGTGTGIVGVPRDVLVID